MISESTRLACEIQRMSTFSVHNILEFFSITSIVRHLLEKVDTKELGNKNFNGNLVSKKNR